jgi:sterol desaturase/sphingolipid hydroxylase (fatty acid hydroxylase superfamily)
MDWSASGAAITSMAGISLLLTGLLVAEIFSPLRPAVSPTTTRWVINAALYLASVLIAAVLVPSQWSLGFGTIGWVERALGEQTAVLLGILSLDFSFYALHRLEHAWAFLWRLHLVHHSDLDLDATTAIRHHPGETLLDCVTLGVVTILLAIPVETIALYGSLALAAQMFQHANIACPDRVERIARLLVVTPGLHHRHHSNERDVADTNFGLVFSIWDRLFGSFDSRSPIGQFGVKGVDWQVSRTLWKTLTLPFGWQAGQSERAGEPQFGRSTENPRNALL